MSRSIRVFIVGEHEITRLGLVTALSRSRRIQVAADMSVDDPALDRYLAEELDVIVLAPALARMGKYVELLRRLRSNRGIKTMGIVPLNDFAKRDDLLCHGVHACVTWSMPIGELHEVVMRLADNRSGVSAPLRLHYGIETKGDSESLSTRENQVLYYLAMGLTREETAGMLCVSSKTIEVYRSRIYKKFGVSKRSEVIRYALDRGYLRIMPGDMTSADL